jgi:glycerol kinase
MSKRYLVALDQGTTSSRAVVFTLSGAQVASASREFRQIYPQPGWVEHDPNDILSSQITALREAVQKADIEPRQIAAIGITNQRETTLLWEKDTGTCVHNAIVWQCRRSASYVEKLQAEGCSSLVRERTGLIPDAYFSATKLQWLLNEHGQRTRAEKGELLFGTVDSFLAWHLVEGHPHVTDATNAARTMLYNLHTQAWDEELLQLFGIPQAVLPVVVDTAQVIGMLRKDILGCEIPVAALAGDQHAALYGQRCLQVGQVKNTYGTGCFMLMNIGNSFRTSDNGLLTTLAWRLKGRHTYALEGSVFVAGAVVQWLRDELELIATASETEALARSVPDTNGAMLVPAFTGMGAPYWDMHARGTMVGITRGTTRAHIVRAALEAIAYQSNDLMRAMAADAGRAPASLRVDGGASANGFLMQFQADIMGIPVVRPAVLESTALGAALLAGLAVGETLPAAGQEDAQTQVFTPCMDEETRQQHLAGWARAVDAARHWAAAGRA